MGPPGVRPVVSAAGRERECLRTPEAAVGALSDSKFSEVLDGTLGPEKARKDPIYS